jgi:uncharacterized membrane protein
MTRFIVLLAAGLALSGPAYAQTPPAAGGPSVREMPGGPGQRARGGPLRQALDAMSPEGRVAVLQSMRDSRPSVAEEEAMRQVRRDIIVLMGADKLDAEALRKAMARERDLAQRNQARRHDVTVQTLQKLSAADRKIYVDTVARMADIGNDLRERFQDRMPTR